jgi:cyclophilin family peptidyl-prolyl cis-trans isomerase
MKSIFVLLTAFTLIGSAFAQNPRVEMKTNRGLIQIELYQDKAPKTVANFLQYAKEGYYTGTLFHRVIDNFMVQGGGFDKDMREKRTRGPIENEATNQLKNEFGTLAMARTSAPHSASAQFFINLKHNEFLNFREPTTQGFGYAVFGRVVQGMDIVAAIAKMRTGRAGTHSDVPIEPIIIEAITVIANTQEKKQ